jgi:membrane protein implicated in regulation of membrane protease activity
VAHHIPITIISIFIVILILVITGYITDPIVDVFVFSILGYISYKAIYVIIKFRNRDLYSLVGKRARALEDIKSGNVGYVILDGEYWKARALEDINAGDSVLIIKRDGLTLYVKKVVDNEKNKN